MSYLAPGDLPMMLREKTEFVLDGRHGRVAQTRATDCLIIWDAYTDPKTSKAHGVEPQTLSSFYLGQMLESNRLHITARPEYRPDGREILKRALTKQRSIEQHNMAVWRQMHIEAADELIAEGLMGTTRDEFVRNIDAINGRGTTKQTKRAKSLSGRSKAGFKYEMIAPPESGATVYRWRQKYLKKGIGGLYDRQDESGNSLDRYSVEELDFAREVIAVRLNEERADIKNILTSVQAAMREENRKRQRHPELGGKLRVLGYGKVWDLIAQIAPVDHAIRTKGMDEAYKDLHCLGLGLQVSRPLERCEMDVYAVDLMVFLNDIGILAHLTDTERLSLGLDGTPQRVLISAVIDVFTGCILAFQIATADTTDLALRTVEMVYLDKQPLADAVGALCPWNMRGHPGTLAVDRGNSYLGDDFYDRLATAGITNLGVPAGKPFLKPWVESWFRGVGSGFLQRFTGRTFGNIIKKGENDPQARATLNLEEFLYWLTRWIVDAYHNTKPRTLGKKAPRLAWDAAVKETPPYALVDDDQLRVAFGVSTKRKLTRQGIRVGNLYYWSEELITHFLRAPRLKDDQLTVYWWAPKIGAISVELPDGRTVQAQCIDPKWHGKNYSDLRRYMAEAAQLDDLAIEAKDRAIVEIDEFSRNKAALAGLIPTQPDAATLDYFEEKYARYIDIPSRKLKGITDIFGDEVVPDFSLPTPQSTSSNNQPRQETPLGADLGSDEDIME